MNDQAQALRDRVKSPRMEQRRKTRIITVSSGKGGVGKSNFTVNFALTLLAKGYKVLIFDADIGMANINVLLGATPPYSLHHLLKRERTIEEVIYRDAYGLQFIAGGSGFNDLVNLSEHDLNRFVAEVARVSHEVDFVIFDTGAGLSKETLKFILSAQETIIVTTPEPTAMTDAYAVIKMVDNLGLNIHFQLVVNRITDRQEGKQTANKLNLVAKQFLSLDIPTLGFIMDDVHVTRAVKKQVPFTIAYPNCAASKSMREVVDRYLRAGHETPATEDGVKRFFNRIMNVLRDNRGDSKR